MNRTWRVGLFGWAVLAVLVAGWHAEAGGPRCRRCREKPMPVKPTVHVGIGLSPAEAEFLTHYRPPPLRYQAPLIPPEARSLIYNEAWGDVPTLIRPARPAPAVEKLPPPKP
jgi:hypothetical protein